MTSTILAPIDWPSEHHGTHAAVELISPALAAKWLGRNTGNRRIRPATVEQYARDMHAGNWKITGEAIKFTADGTLIDGQHRLSAVVLADTSVSMYVIRGLDLDVGDLCDTGMKRTAADALARNGHLSTKGLAASARLAIGWTEGQIKVSTQQQVRQVTHAEILRFVEGHPDLVEATALGGPLRLQVPPSVVAFTLWLTRAVDIDDATTFFSVLHEHRTSGPGDPLLSLTRRLSSIKSSRERVSKITFAYYIIRTWNAVRNGEKMFNLKVANAHGPFAFPAPA